MAIECTMNGNVLEVKSSLLGFHQTRVSYWYYDVKNWLASRGGFKDEIPTTPMDERAIEWVQSYYLPKANKTAQG